MYIYTCVDDDGLPWKYERPSDVGRLRGVNLVLYLVRSPADDYWYAIDAAADVVGGASAILQVGHRIFRTRDYAVAAGSWNWERNRSGLGQTAVWQTLCPFKTELLH